VILLHGTNTLGNQIKSLKNDLLNLSEIENVSVSDYLPVSGTEVKRNGLFFWEEGKTPKESSASGQFWIVDEDYIDTFGLNIIEGRGFAKDPGNNLRKAVINTTLVKALGLKDAIGSRISNGEYVLEIVGIIADFHFESLKGPIGGLCMMVGKSQSVVSIKATTTNTAGLLQSIEDIWNPLSASQSLRYSFLDQRFANMYQDVKRTGRIVTSFSVLAIIVACLGLFGLATFIAEQRGKEMSIRKVLGASVQNIFNMLTINFLKLVSISLLIAMPLAWLGMQQWLESFSYRINIAWWFFVVSGIMAIIIALITISNQALKVAFSNPVDSLRNE